MCPSCPNNVPSSEREFGRSMPRSLDGTLCGCEGHTKCRAYCGNKRRVVWVRRVGGVELDSLAFEYGFDWDGVFGAA